jgi:hypothetical protein
MLMEKAETMRHQACLPQSWWEFAVDHATHVYNRTPLSRLNWQTPFELLNKERPAIDHLHVFGCGAYVYLPAEVRANKLAPKSELMIYLGNAPGAHGFIFMCSPNNVLFYTVHCIFDEMLFPKCRTQAKRLLTRLHELAPGHFYHEDPIPPVEDEEQAPQKLHSSHKEREKSISRQKKNTNTESEKPLPRSMERHPPQEKPPSPMPAPRRSERTTKVPVQPGNIYGETRHPVDILRDPKGKAPT